jgi:hypothetical protein
MTHHPLLRARVSILALAASLLGTVVVGAVGVVHKARADAPSATIGDLSTSHEHFNRGVEYVHDGDLKGALIEFKRAYAVSPNYRVLYNLGQVANALGKYTDAQSYFQRYLSEGQDEIAAERRHDVENTLAKLAGRIATLELSTNLPGAEIFVDEVSVGISPLAAPVRVSSGSRTISAAINGKPRIVQTVEVAGGDSVAVHLNFAQQADQPKAEAPLLPAAHIEAKPRKPEPQDSAGNPALWLGIATGALAVGSGVMGYLTLRDAQSYDAAVARKTSVQELDNLDSRASTKALVTDVLLGATVVGATITTIVLLQGNQERKPQTQLSGAAPKLSLGLGSVSLRGAF